MGYQFRIVPLQELTTYSAILNTLPNPIDRPQALQLGACSLVVRRSAAACLAGIAAEKRQLASWVREQRSSIRLMQFKGAAQYRATANANVSNDADAARNKLDWLKDFAPECLEISSTKLQLALQWVSIEEANTYIATYTEEVQRVRSAEQAKGLLVLLLILAILFLFIALPLGLILLLVSMLVYAGNKKNWDGLAAADAKRKQQLQEVSLRQQEEELYNQQLQPAAAELDDTRQASLQAIAKDLRSTYQVLDVACRDLGSRALTWQQLAEEVLAGMQAPTEPSVPAVPSPPLAARPSEAAPEPRANSTASPPEAGAARGSHRIAMTMDEVREILQSQGYKRMPRDWSSISSRAEDKICQAVAARLGVPYESYLWTLQPGLITAERFWGTTVLSTSKGSR